jgi:hypothetical protein
MMRATVTFGNGSSQDVRFAASNFDEYLREYENSTLQEFMTECDTRLPMPQGLSKMEAVLTKMWERAIDNIPIDTKKRICDLVLVQVPFRIAAQIAMLAEANPRQFQEISLSVMGALAVPN